MKESLVMFCCRPMKILDDEEAVKTQFVRMFRETMGRILSVDFDGFDKKYIVALYDYLKKEVFEGRSVGLENVKRVTQEMTREGVEHLVSVGYDNKYMVIQNPDGSGLRLGVSDAAISEFATAIFDYLKMKGRISGEDRVVYMEREVEIASLMDNGEMRVNVGEASYVERFCSESEIQPRLDGGSVPQSGAGAKKAVEYVVVLGRRRRVVMKGRKKYVNVRGELMALSEAKKKVL